MLDFTFGDPREMAPEAYVSALRTAVTPQHADWFAYKQYEPAAQEAAAASLGQLTGLPFEPDDILLTTGGFAALSVGMKAVADPGDEVIYSLPPWFAYETLLVEAGLVPVKVRIDLETLDLDVDAIAAAITPRTRIVIVNTPNNPTGRVYSAETLTRLATVLEEASARNGRRIFLLSDEPYNRIVFSGSPVPDAGRVLPLHPGGLQLRQDAPRRRGSASAIWRCRPRCRTERRCAARCTTCRSPSAGPSPTPSCSTPCRSWSSRRSTWRGWSGGAT